MRKITHLLKCFWVLQENVFAWYKPDLHFWIYHAGHKSAEDAGKVLCLSFCNRCGWHSTKVVRDTLSYHPLSHQLSTQWKSCSTASNTWASLEVTFSFSDLIFFWQEKNTCAPPGQEEKRLNKSSSKWPKNVFNLQIRWISVTGDPTPLLQILDPAAN